MKFVFLVNVFGIYLFYVIRYIVHANQHSQDLICAIKHAKWGNILSKTVNASLIPPPSVYYCRVESPSSLWQSVCMVEKQMNALTAKSFLLHRKISALSNHTHISLTELWLVCWFKYSSCILYRAHILILWF